MIIVVLSVVALFALFALLVALPTWIVVRDLRAGRPDPGIE